MGFFYEALCLNQPALNQTLPPLHLFRFSAGASCHQLNLPALHSSLKLNKSVQLNTLAPLFELNGFPALTLIPLTLLFKIQLHPLKAVKTTYFFHLPPLLFFSN